MRVNWSIYAQSTRQTRYLTAGTPIDHPGSCGPRMACRRNLSCVCPSSNVPDQFIQDRLQWSREQTPRPLADLLHEFFVVFQDIDVDAAHFDDRGK